MSLADVQARLEALGFDPGPIDNLWGRRTEGAINAALDRLHAPAPIREPVIPEAWMPPARMERVIVHWTGGTWRPSGTDREHYHFLIDGDGMLHLGVPVWRNEAPVKAGYAAHTLNLNSGSIGVALCAMWGAVERPFDAGSYPVTREQWERLANVCADLCERYGIEVSPKTLLSHAEVEGTLGIAQRGKWDVAALPFEEGAPQGAGVIGDRLRREVLALL